MSKMFRHALFVALMAALTGAAFAAQDQSQSQPQSKDEQTQGHRHGQMMHKGDQNHMQMMAEKLNLTDEQKQKVQKLHQDTQSQAEAIRNDKSLSQDQKHEKIQQLHKEAMGQMMSILTPEQQEKFKQMQQEHKKGMHDMDEKKKGAGDQQHPGV